MEHEFYDIESIGDKTGGSWKTKGYQFCNLLIIIYCLWFSVFGLLFCKLIPDYRIRIHNSKPTTLSSDPMHPSIFILPAAFPDIRKPFLQLGRGGPVIHIKLHDKILVPQFPDLGDGSCGSGPKDFL